MCNCNQKRAMYTSTGNSSQRSMVRAVLIRKKPMVLNGDVTGRMYVFRNFNDTAWVDRRDAATMAELDGLRIEM